MNALINQTIEKALNEYLALDPESSERLAALEGKDICIELLLAEHSEYLENATIKLKIHNKKLHLMNNADNHSHVIIKGTPLSLLHMSISKENRKQFFADNVSIEGDLELGQQIIDLFDCMEIDWEEHASRLVGDVSAHQLGRFARSIKKFVSGVRESLRQNINEYVHEEVMMFPPREQLNDFFHDIDLLRMDADRLEAKINHLKIRSSKRVL